MSDSTEADRSTTTGSRCSLRIRGEEAIVQVRDGFITLPIVGASEELSTWLDEGRQAMYDQLLDASAGAVRYFAQHLPMVVTYNLGRVFPSTCGNKGVAFLPRADYLDEYISRYRETMEASKAKPQQDSSRRRVRTAVALDLNPEEIERRCLVTLEIFERQTFRNLQELPLATLFFTGDDRSIINFQVNCAVEVIGSDDPRYTFATLSRSMFGYEGLHITEHEFPCAYVFWITECVRKTPSRIASAIAL